MPESFFYYFLRIKGSQKFSTGLEYFSVKNKEKKAKLMTRKHILGGNVQF